MFEAVRGALEGACQGGLALFAYFGGAAGMDALRRHHADAGMTMLLVVPSEELGAVGTCISQRAEAGRETRLVLQGFELRFGIRVVVGNVGPAMRR